MSGRPPTIGPMSEFTPFTLDIPQSALDELRRRLDDARRPDELPGAAWDYGVSGGYLRDLAGRWTDEFDWRAQERALNAWPQFTTDIDGQHLHFAHVRSSRPDAIPLLLVHGWPSTLPDPTARPASQEGGGGSGT